MVAYYMGVRTPNFVFAYDDAGIDEVHILICFCLFFCTDTIFFSLSVSVSV